ncbi:hypothetical protein [Nocardia acidivorans]|uniref:hypothetical protein n=1 Tax=Nocardia acidivorans TaxID=404580 RepID=UPI0008339C26|nr:hypothetical protein [Nocardia acidivorans]
MTSRQIGRAFGVAIIGSPIATMPGALDSADASRTPARQSWHAMTGFAVLALIVTEITVARRPAAWTPLRHASLTVGLERTW